MDRHHDIPSTQTVILQDEAGILRITPNSPIPELSPHQMLVRTTSVALNPCDFKMPLRFPTQGLWDGCDFAGIVVALGSEAIAQGRFRLGDRVFGAVQGSNQSDPQSGAYCEYIRAEPDFTFHSPEGTPLTLAPALSCTGIATLGIALFWSLQLPGNLDEPSIKAEDVLVYGGSSTIGLLAIQMVKLCGHRVITTCSPRNFELVKSYGADLVFDYKSPTCAQDIRSATKNALRHVLDPFAESKTVRLCQDAIGRTGGRYCALEQYTAELISRKTVKHELVMGGAIAGKGVDLPVPYGIPPRPEIGEWARPWYRTLQTLIDTGKLRPCPQSVLPGRFDGILKGLEMLKRGDVSGKKLIVSLEGSA
ncbi:Polyketide synthase enoylreductase [Penicillium maclennaniae]|uniref:Polyketide synthase enoylreductase n=1 Tax=Penicillium maclennaniae TaxID=1343394 RepID=UPI002541FA4C|nr:Polyketide synthase enoylreductase [Penicillium maclennaniae]KAJ5682113.1 Polyketide synthase enoylreductase [Penicillium maclennaniae]